MKLSTISFLLILSTMMQCTSHRVEINPTMDPDIFLVNIENGDRHFIARLLEKVDSCQPAVVGIDAYFMGEKDEQEDSVLMQALIQTRNDILIYSYTARGKRLQSHSKFTVFASDQGLIEFEGNDDLNSKMVPLRTIDNSLHESISLKIVQKWKPGFNHSFRKGRAYPIHYTRTLDQFLTLYSSDFDNMEEGLLKNKVVLIGYAGPTNEDKYYTPIRRVIEYPRDSPDTYGLVILANEIRTILEYEKQN